MKKYSNKTNFKLPFSLLFLLVFTIGCEKSNIREGLRDTISIKPTADTKLINVGNTITYTDESNDVSLREWTFEGGNTTSSTEQTVNVLYETNGTFLTEIAVTHSDGLVENHSFNIDVEPLVVANYSASSNAALFGSEITFTNLSLNTESAFPEAAEEDSFLWEFEGGVPATSTLKDPVVTYPTTGVFDVKLTVFRNIPTSEDVLVQNDFITIVDVDVIGPASVNLTDLGSKLSISYETALNPVDPTKYTLLVDDMEASFIASVDPMDPNSFLFTLDTPVTEGQSILLNYTGGGDFAVTGELLAPIVDFTVTNTVANLFAKGDFEGVTTNEYDVNNGFLGNMAGQIVADLVDGEGVDGSRGLIFSATAATAGARRTIFGDKNMADVQLIEPIEPGADYLVKAMVKYTGTAPIEVRFSMVGYTFDNVIVNAPLIGTLLAGEWVEVEAQFTAPANNKPSSYAIPNVTVGAGASSVILDNIKVFKL